MLEETPGTCTNLVGTPASGRDADTEGGNYLPMKLITANTVYCLAMRSDSSMLEVTPGTQTNVVVVSPAGRRDTDTECKNLVSNEVNNNHH